jgi:hypothetical protein
MDKILLGAFQMQIALQCNFALRAARELDTAKFPEDVFYALQNLLNASANLSKAFWGSGCKFEKEREPLRESVGIDDNSPLRQVTMRNNFEHYDERLDKWRRESKTKNHIDLNVTTTIMWEGLVDDLDQFRHYNPQTTDLTFWGQKFNIKAIIEEVKRLQPKAQEAANKSGR